MKSQIQLSVKMLIEHLRQQGVCVEMPTHGLQHELTGLAPLKSAQAQHLSFLANPKFRQDLKASQAGAVLLTQDHVVDCPGIALVTPTPYLAYAKASQLMQAQRGDPLRLDCGLHQVAVIDETSQLGQCHIGPGVVIGPGVHIGDDVHIGANTVIGAGVTIGTGSVIGPLVSIYPGVCIGRYCRIQSQASIGADGFGFAPTPNGWEPISQLGRVDIGDYVHIGANTSIDRGALESTRIGNGVIIDNQVQIAHNVIIGEHTAIAGCVGIAGSTHIGARCTLAGAAGVAGHLIITDDVHIGMQAQVTKSIDVPGHYGSGTGLYSIKAWRRLVGHFRRSVKH